MPTDVDKLIEAGHDINSFGPAVLADLVHNKIITVNEARRALRLPPMSYQEAGEKVLYNATGRDIYNSPGSDGRAVASEAPPVEETVGEVYNGPGETGPAPRPQKTVYRPTTPPKRGRPPQPNWTSKYPPSPKQIGLLKYLVKEAELPITVLDALAVEEARRSGGADAKFVTGWYAMSGKIASRVIDRLKADSSEEGDEEEMPAF